MAEDDLLGKQVGNFLITKLLGKGGMGAVYLAGHPRIGRQVAIKVLSPALASHPNALGRFVSEAQLLTRIKHPNIIEIYDFGNLDDGSLYYIMEVLEGCELRDLMREKPKRGSREIMPYLQQICGALQAAHDQGIVHRDLKPENIFVLDGEPMSLKILDFGIAKLLEDKQGPNMTATGTVVGSPIVIAPEQAAGEPDRIGTHTDIYSLGIILYWMICGRPPFMADAPGRLMLKHIKDEPPPLQEREPSVPDDVAWVVHQCLAKEPEDRPGSARAVYSAFASATKWEGELVEASIDGQAPDNTPTLVEDKYDQPTVIRGRKPSGVDANATTMGGATGESTTESHTEIVESGRRQRRLKWLALAIAVTSLLAVGITLLESRHPANKGNTPAAAPAPPTTAPPPAATREQPPAPVAKPAVTPPDAALAAAPDAAPAPAAVKAARKTTRKPHKAKAAVPRAPPVEEKASPKKIKPSKIGEGTMEVDL